MLSKESGSAIEEGKPEDLRAMGSVLKPDALRVLGSVTVLSLLPACALAHGGPGLVTVGPMPPPGRSHPSPRHPSPCTRLSEFKSATFCCIAAI